MIRLAGEDALLEILAIARRLEERAEEVADFERRVVEAAFGPPARPRTRGTR